MKNGFFACTQILPDTEIPGHVRYTPSPGSVHSLASHFVRGGGLVKGCNFRSETCVTGGFRSCFCSWSWTFPSAGTGRSNRRCQSGAGPSCQEPHRSGEAETLSGEHVIGPWLLLLGLTVLCLCCSKIKALLRVSGNKVFSVWLYFYSDIQI